MKIVSNAGPLIALAKIERLEVLRGVFGRVYIPQAVYHEVVVKGTGRVGADDVQQAGGDWLDIVPVQNVSVSRSLSAKLGPGEAEAIALALEMSAALILLDDRQARAAAEFLGLKVSGTVGVLIQAYRAGLGPDLPQSLERLRARGFRLTDEVLAEAARKAEM